MKAYRALSFPVDAAHSRRTNPVASERGNWARVRRSPASRERRQCLLLALATTLLVACDPGGVSSRPTADAGLEDTLRALIEEAYDFSRPGVPERMSSLFADGPDIVSASAGAMIVGADSIRSGVFRFWENVGRNMTNPTWQWGDVAVRRLSADNAVLTATWSIPHIAPDSQPHVIAGAWTAVFSRIGGRWKIVQEHLSVPPPPEPEMAAGMDHSMHTDSGRTGGG